MRIMVPPYLQKKILDELHEGHPGVVHMEEVAQSYVWWPGIDADMENTMKMCAACQQKRALPTQAPLHPWAWPTRPRARLHLDFAGPAQFFGGGRRPFKVAGGVRDALNSGRSYHR
ncbi:hypothetical protein V5799_024085 [Amblyomma americanum]|uniref:RNA-directed DNA polymerase n=1 Tax=Amblyomma americanum TaxID=6943 RepID=A0AAQ4EDE1_AMBAM